MMADSFAYFIFDKVGKLHLRRLLTRAVATVCRGGSFLAPAIRGKKRFDLYMISTGRQPVFPRPDSPLADAR
jgi:hypothetical protein